MKGLFLLTFINTTTPPHGGLLYALQPEIFGDGLAIELATPA